MMAKRELFSTAFGGWLFRKLGAIEVEREATDRGALRVSQAGAPRAVSRSPSSRRARGGPARRSTSCTTASRTWRSRAASRSSRSASAGPSRSCRAGKVLPRIHKVAIVIGEPDRAAADGRRAAALRGRRDHRGAADATAGVLRRGAAPRGGAPEPSAVSAAGPRARLRRRPSGRRGTGRRACGSRAGIAADEERAPACRAPGAAHAARVAAGSTRPRR